MIDMNVQNLLISIRASYLVLSMVLLNSGSFVLAVTLCVVCISAL